MPNSLTIGRLSYAILPTPYRLFHNQKSVLAICDHERREILVREGLSDDALRAVLLDVTARILATIRSPGDLLDGYPKASSTHEASGLRESASTLEHLTWVDSKPTGGADDANAGPDAETRLQRRFD